MTSPGLVPNPAAVPTGHRVPAEPPVQLAQLWAKAPAENEIYRSTLTPAPQLGPRIEFWTQLFTQYHEGQRIVCSLKTPNKIYFTVDAPETEYREFRYAVGRALLGRKPLNDLDRALHRAVAALTPEDKTQLQRDLIRGELGCLRGIRERIAEGIARGAEYLPAFEKAFRDAGLPAELSRLALVESQFRNDAVSRSLAVGMWQFLAPTARQYGLHVTAAIDERRDPFLSVQAAAKYLRDAAQALHGNLPLAITSYNRGIAGVEYDARVSRSVDLHHIVERAHGNGFGFDVANYYPEFLAAVEIVRKREQYFPGLNNEKLPAFEELRTPRAVSFAKALACSGLSKEDFLRLNPALLRPVTTGRLPIPKGTLLRVGAGKSEDAQKGMMPPVHAR